MKGVAAARNSGREQALERQRRDRAAVATLRDRYPQFASLRLEFVFSDDAPFTPVPQATVLHPPARAYFVFPCPYTDCAGEFDLTCAVVEMVDGGGDRISGHMKCGGTRAAAGPERARCGLTLQYSVIAQRD